MMSTTTTLKSMHLLYVTTFAPHIIFQLQQITPMHKWKRPLPPVVTVSGMVCPIPPEA